MQRLGLHGKAVMPFLISFGCNIGGVAGTRVIESWQQRLLAISTSWVIPCAYVWGVVALKGTTFFGGGGAVLIVLSLFAVAVIYMFITSRMFGRTLLADGIKLVLSWDCRHITSLICRHFCGLYGIALKMFYSSPYA